MPPQAGRRLTVAASRAGAATPPRLPEPPGLSGWDVAFLYSLADWPLPLRPDQRAIIRWIARRARAA